MIHFERVAHDTLYIAEEIWNSNPEYIEVEHGESYRTSEQIEEELLHHDTTSLFVKLDDTYIGIINYMDNNPNDGYPWLGLLMIHRDYQGYMFGTQAYLTFRQQIQDKGMRALRLGILPTNKRAEIFWRSLGFTFVCEIKGVLVYETSFVEET
ncbi:GNAT family N-acetyltransferase [Pontibacillus litoralis]|uniref:N-acetyltransferase domain-containing protein n=1 Tax=Pontibacillus litoralis JSM 072002 TaxID=1385512 RepID=A0A0A5G354_9BACI|nr:GNAT family N-acetyltransferase [Pontibacillus litoralis]KGX85558.1 hypothetical protein N784_08600 [Pontibacillus litoralis JSM 072002]